MTIFLVLLTMTALVGLGALRESRDDLTQDARRILAAGATRVATLATRVAATLEAREA